MRLYRKFPSGATRDTDEHKLDFDGFFSPYAMRRFAEYMHKHRSLPDGTSRAGDNWQRGIPIEVYRKSLWRHFFDVWCFLLGLPFLTGQSPSHEDAPIDVEEALCGLMFNVQGLLHEIVQRREVSSEKICD